MSRRRWYDSARSPFIYRKLCSILEKLLWPKCVQMTGEMVDGDLEMSSTVGEHSFVIPFD